WPWIQVLSASHQFFASNVSAWVYTDLNGSLMEDKTYLYCFQYMRDLETPSWITKIFLDDIFVGALFRVILIFIFSIFSVLLFETMFIFILIILHSLLIL
ncbi:hypothetical protein ACJX0J_025488, partial [Zea mays]